MRRKLAGVTVGLLLALIVIVLVEAVANRLFNAQLTTDPSATVASIQQPTAMLATVVLGWFVAALIGGGFAAYICRIRTAAWVVAVAVLIGVATRLLTEAQPAWMFVAGPLAPLVGGALAQFWAGNRLAGRLPANKVGRDP